MGRPPQKGGQSISKGAELFLFLAARAELVAKVLRQSSEDDNLVIVADRYADSTVAYQGYGRRLSVAAVEEMNRLATGGVMPHLTILLDCAPEVGLGRVGAVQIALPLDVEEVLTPGRMDEEDSRRFEDEPLEFHRRLRAGYRAMAEPMNPIGGASSTPTMAIDDVHEQVWRHVEPLLPASAGAPAAQLELHSQGIRRPFRGLRRHAPPDPSLGLQERPSELPAMALRARDYLEGGLAPWLPTSFFRRQRGRGSLWLE